MVSNDAMDHYSGTNGIAVIDIALTFSSSHHHHHRVCVMMIVNKKTRRDASILAEGWKSYWNRSRDIYKRF